MKQVVIGIAAVLSLSGCLSTGTQTHADPCGAQPASASEHTIACYRDRIEQQPLQYAMTADEASPGVTRRVYRLTSQSWSPAQRVEPAEWQHEVTLFIPDHALRERALLVANNGIRINREQRGPVAATDFSVEQLAEIARNTGTVVVAIDNIPNQYLTYGDDGRARAEDVAVAHSWTLFMDAPQQTEMSLHVPMMAALSRAMTLAERELAPLGISRFVVSGISKRAWASWLSAIADPRVEAIVPFVFDLLNVRKGLEHMRRSYGGNWPISFEPYYRESVDTRIESPQFASLMTIEDPLAYARTAFVARLAIPKYIVNASGDDFYVPDNSWLYYDRLPGSKALRVAPNAAHRDIRKFTVESLTTFLNRLRHGTPLPEVRTTLEANGLRVWSSEPPRQLLLWSAVNTQARDFRYACGIRYTATPIDASAPVAVATPPTGWAAYFVEATYADGFVATGQVHIVGNRMYPDSPPPEQGKACRTLSGR